MNPKDNLSQLPETSHNTDKTSKFSGLKNWTRAGVLSVLVGLGFAKNADAQIQELGVTAEDSTRSSWLLKDMGQQIVKWDESYPNQQHFTIYRIETEDIDNWRDHHTKILSTSNSEITVDDLGDRPSEIIETQVNGRQARKVIHNKLTPGKYVLQTKINASSPTNPQGIITYTTRLFVEVDEEGNEQVFKIESPKGEYETNGVGQYFNNHVGADISGIEFTDKSNGEIQISMPVPVVSDGSSDISLDMDWQGQSGAKLIFELNDGTEIVKTAEDIDYDTANNRLVTSIIQQPGQYIVAISSQHEGVEPIEITGPLNVDEQRIANSIVFYPNPVPQGQDLHLQLPEGIAYLGVPYEIVDISGKQIMSGVLDDKTALLPFVSQQTGAYLLRFKIGKTVYTKKIVVQ